MSALRICCVARICRREFCLQATERVPSLEATTTKESQGRLVCRFEAINFFLGT